MSYISRTSGASPFCQTTHSTDFTSGTRWDTKSQTWLSTDSGTTGHQFDGKGYVWGHFVNDGTALASMICTSETANRGLASSLLDHSNSAFSSSDNWCLQFSNNTEYSILDNYHGQFFHPSLKSYSRLNIVRIEKPS